MLLSEVGSGNGSECFNWNVSTVYLDESSIHLLLWVVILLETYMSLEETWSVILSAFSEMFLHFLVLRGLFLNATLS